MARLLISLAALAATAIAGTGRTASDCTIGDTWTTDFIRYECYAGTGNVVKGVRAIGCVPTKTEGGAMLKPGQTHDEKYFTYECKQNSNVVSYEIINCIDSAGKKLQPGEKRATSDSITWNCYREGDKVMLGQTKPGGCEYNGKTYKAGQSWQQQVDLTATVNGKKVTIGKAILMTCKSNGAGGYSSEAYGCLTSSGAQLGKNQFGTVDKLFVRCIAEGSSYKLTVATDSEMECSFEGKKYEHGATITSKDKTSEFKCQYGVVGKIRCLINGKTINYNAIDYIDGKAFYCGGGTGYTDFGKLTGCTLPDGTVKKFLETWTADGVKYRCRFSISGSIAKEYIESMGCYYKDQLVYLNTLYVKGTEIMKCVAKGDGMLIRKLTEEEYTAYIKSQNKGDSGSVIGGEGGSGSGGSMTGQPTERPTPAPTTEARPTKPRETPAPETDAPRTHPPPTRVPETEEPTQTPEPETQPPRPSTTPERGTEEPTETPEPDTQPPRPSTTLEPETQEPTQTPEPETQPPRPSTTIEPETEAPSPRPTETPEPETQPPRPSTTPEPETEAPTQTPEPQTQPPRPSTTIEPETEAPSPRPTETPELETQPPRPSTTPEPETEAPSTRPEPQTTEKPTARPTERPSPRPTIVPSTVPPLQDSTTEIVPTTAKPSTCKDSFEFCSLLAPVCAGGHGTALGHLREILQKENISVDALQDVMNVITNDEPSSKDDAAELVKALRGESEEEEEEGCGCGENEGCQSRCARKTRVSPCKRCGIFKRKLHHLVTVVCPATCNTCHAGGDASDIVKILVKFYTSGCH